MENTQHGANAANNFLIIGSTAHGSGRITQDMVTNWLTRFQRSVSRDRSVLQTSASQVGIDSSVAEENDVVVEVQEFVPEEEITVVESGEIIRSKTSSKCLVPVSVSIFCFSVGPICLVSLIFLNYSFIYHSWPLVVFDIEFFFLIACQLLWYCCLKCYCNVIFDNKIFIHPFNVVICV